MDGLMIESDGGFMFVSAVSQPEKEPNVTFTVKSREGNATDVKVETVADFASLARRVRSFMLAGPDVTRFRIVMDDYTLVGVRNGDGTFAMIGVDGFSGRVDKCDADISGGHFVNVVAVAVLAVAGDNLSDSEAEDLYPLADLICGTWISKPYP